MSTIEDNKLIAEFMGWDINNISTIPTNLHPSNLELDNGEKFIEKFDSSWDWLMPVVEKIEGYGYDFIASKRRATLTYDANFMDEVNNEVVYVEDCKDRKEATYKAVVEFIKQHK